MSANTTDPMIGRLIDGRYQVRSRIARGGMATVYLATDLRLERRVAIKVMHGHLSDDSAFKQRFIQEARSAARLAHPNVVNVFDQGQDEDYAYLVMEYLPGITLRDLIEEYGSLTAEQTLDITEAVLSGLAAAHKAGIVHRDLKPENVLLADDGRIKIGDFGLARAATANTATGAALMGTIAYLSPELVTRGVADTRSDIYAVGIMMYEMLTGEQPFKGEQPMQIAYQHANDSVPVPSGKNSKVPAELDELVLWATARDPEHRPRDARQMLDQLHETEALLRTALPTGSTTTQRTMVLPPAPAAAFAGSDAETQVLGSRASSRNDTAPSPMRPATAQLATIARRRRRRAPFVLILVVLLAALAGTTGWYFGAGPGAHATIPNSVVNTTPEDATAILTELGLAVADETSTAHSVDVAAGDVMATEPAVGSSVRLGEEVTLVISLGPREVTLEALSGRPLEDVTEALTDEGLIIVDPVIEQFSSEIESGLVISATDLDAEDGPTDLSQGGTTFEGRSIELVVSVGAVPVIMGETPEVATQRLADVNLTVDGSREIRSYSDDVAEGRVIGLVRSDEPRRPGQTVGLEISRGPEPVQIPDVEGKTWLEARPILEAAGLVVEYWNNNSRLIGETLPGIATVEEIDPEEGETVPKNSTVRVRLSAD
ncbi:Stk1 family PASTA domain-containing Ser/Thr kinase [uncultured Schumannella sp.]|uniref:Stk1 family PASTA domain-containing Ser/Thr kinase n=1 Tax=uncultured Schumannella sp. TaxID=1195956 RepID=UPI0025E9C351|nr:Stk1 family PASTA domain-containing Ser/Thr kinase [uncultured Schumannella sp.]